MYIPKLKLRHRRKTKNPMFSLSLKQGAVAESLDKLKALVEPEIPDA